MHDALDGTPDDLKLFYLFEGPEAGTVSGVILSSSLSRETRMSVVEHMTKHKRQTSVPQVLFRVQALIDD